ncbi:MAG: hypothetical protein LBJ43_03125 [Propionibacteriaceae bacterium]|nr:hypothetical protein [Propionibacteriaceae bacterium]
MVSKPDILVFAGPNGSGKSTFVSAKPPIGVYVNADDIASATGISMLEAALEAEKLREYCLAEGLPFSFETVLSTERNLDLLRRAVTSGRCIESIFVLTVDPELNAQRIARRVAEGGHDVPAEKIRSRYTKTLANLPKLVQLSTICTVYDNTWQPEIIYRKDDAGEVVTPTLRWPEEVIRKLVYGST